MIVRQIGRIEIYSIEGQIQNIRTKIASIFDDDGDYIIAKEGSGRYLTIFEEITEKEEKKKKK